MERRCFKTAVRNSNLNQQVLGRFFRILNEHVKVAAIIENARIEEFVLKLVTRPAPVRPDEVRVWIGLLRILVEILHVRVRWRAIEVEIILLHILAVIALAIGQPEKTFLQDWIFAVPERKREAEILFIVGEAGKSVLAPAIRAA
jgi:hypothetical protein